MNDKDPSELLQRRIDQAKRYYDDLPYESEAESHEVLGEINRLQAALNEDIPARNVREKLRSIRDSVKDLFVQAAKRVEAENNFTIDVNAEGIALSDPQKTRVSSFSKSMHKANISLRSQAVALDLLVGINEGLISAAQNETTPTRRRELFATQAIYVHELCVVIIDMLSSLENLGGAEIRALYEQEMQEIDAILQRIESRQKRGQSAQGQSPGRAEGWVKALDATRKTWGEVLKIISDQDKWISEARRAKERFEVIKEDASIQLAVLERSMVLGAVLDAIQILRSIMEIDDLPLLHVDDHVIRQLLHLDPISMPSLRDKTAITLPKAKG